MDITSIPYELPDTANHSFFFQSQRISVGLEAKLHRHDAWEICFVTKGYGKRTAGDMVMPFVEGEVAMLPPNIHHRWEYAPQSADADGQISYLMVARNP